MIDSTFRICSPVVCVALLATPVPASINPHCFDAVELAPGSLFTAQAMNDQGMLVGTSDDRMAVLIDGELTVVTAFPESDGAVINESGQAAGLGSYGILQDDRLVRRNTNGSVQILAVITGSGPWAHLMNINESGSIVGNYSQGSGSSEWTAFTWTDDDGFQLIAPDMNFSYFTDIDENDRACGYIQVDGTYTAATWQNGALTTYEDLPDMDGSSAALGFDDDGRILMSGRPNNDFVYFWYDTDTGVRQDIHVFPYPTYSLRNTFSGNGSIAFSWSDTSSAPYAARWSYENGFEEITLEDPIVGFTVNGINDDGIVIGTSFELPFYDQRAKLWAEAPFLINLDSNLEAEPLSSLARSINSAGQVQLDATGVPMLLDPRCEGDLNGDGAADVSDLLQVISDWSTDGGGPCGSDGNDDGIVNVDDLLNVIANWNSCG